MEGRCFFCGHIVSLDIPIGSKDYCENCKRDLHCCYNCKYYDPGAPNDCKEPFSPFIRDRGESNVCHFFVFITNREDKSESELAKAKLEALFGKKNQSEVRKDFIEPLEELAKQNGVTKESISKSKLEKAFEKLSYPKDEELLEGIKFANKRKEEREKEAEAAKKALEELFKKKK